MFSTTRMLFDDPRFPKPITKDIIDIVKKIKIGDSGTCVEDQMNEGIDRIYFDIKSDCDTYYDFELTKCTVCYRMSAKFCDSKKNECPSVYNNIINTHSWLDCNNSLLGYDEVKILLEDYHQQNIKRFLNTKSARNHIS